MNKILILLVSLIGEYNLIAQDTIHSTNHPPSNFQELKNPAKLADNCVYIEGSFLIQSLNYERNFFRSRSNSFLFNGRAGIGYLYIDIFSVTRSVGGVFGLNFSIGKNNNYFDSSIGSFVGYENGIIAWPLVTLGYRYQNPSGGFLFKSHIGTIGFDIGLGYAF